MLSAWRKSEFDKSPSRPYLTGMDNTKHSSTRRQHEIQMALRAEYSQGAVNEMHVARLRHEMSALPHRHVLNEDKVCGWCHGLLSKLRRVNTKRPLTR